MAPGALAGFAHIQAHHTRLLALTVEDNAYLQQAKHNIANKWGVEVTLCAIVLRRQQDGGTTASGDALCCMLCPSCRLKLQQR